MNTLIVISEDEIENMTRMNWNNTPDEVKGFNSALSEIKKKGKVIDREKLAETIFNSIWVDEYGLLKENSVEKSLYLQVADAVIKELKGG